MRIGYDATLLRTEPAGVENTVAALLRAMVALGSGDEFVVYCGRRWAVPEWLARPNVRVRRMPFDSSWRIPRILWQQLRLPSVANSDRLDVFHGPAYVLPVWMGVPWGLGVPAALSAADAIALSHPKLCRKSTVAHLRVLPKSCRAARRIIVPSEASAAELVRLAGADRGRIRVVPHGIGEEFRPIRGKERRAEERRRLKLPDRYLLFVGQIEPRKNLVGLIRAFFAARCNQGLAHRLVIAGKPAWRWREVFAEVRNLGVSDAVLFTGYLSPEALPRVCALADALVMPSIVEGFGLPALEAAACGVPVLTSMDPALVEVTGDVALHVDAGNLRDLREGIERILTDEPLRRRLAAAGPERAAAFTWERAARAVLGIYREIREEDRREMEDLNRRAAERRGG
ncbi:MAG TPA: glycosyltransferase family 1 protein [Planctomycetota bacterium]|nr:glycosyltransferase family 1 protein [Planctomycetota bacterium]